MQRALYRVKKQWNSLSQRVFWASLTLILFSVCLSAIAISSLTNIEKRRQTLNYIQSDFKPSLLPMTNVKFPKNGASKCLDQGVDNMDSNVISQKYQNRGG